MEYLETNMCYLIPKNPLCYLWLYTLRIVHLVFLEVSLHTTCILAEDCDKKNTHRGSKQREKKRETVAHQQLHFNYSTTLSDTHAHIHNRMHKVGETIHSWIKNKTKESQKNFEIQLKTDENNLKREKEKGWGLKINQAVISTLQQTISP